LMIGVGIMSKWSELKTGCIALLTLPPYYMILFFFNSWLKKHLTIQITENSVD